jgi:DNA-binding CsgD family transcriptional regulator
MTKRRGYPDRRGMGAQSDVLAEQFKPDEQYKSEQTMRVQHLLAAGMSPEQVAKMFSISLSPVSDQKPIP